MPFFKTDTVILHFSKNQIFQSFKKALFKALFSSFKNYLKISILYPSQWDSQCHRNLYLVENLADFEVDLNYLHNFRYQIFSKELKFQKNENSKNKNENSKKIKLLQP